MNDRDIKKAAEKIRMSDELSKRIISSCENTNKIIENSDGYTDYHFVAEHVKPKRFLHTLSGIAACLVVLGGVGLTLGLLSKGSSPMTLVDDFETEETAEETTEEMTEENTEEPTESAPIYDFSECEISEGFDGIYQNTKLTDEDRIKISEFINSLELTETNSEWAFKPFISFSSGENSISFSSNNILYLTYNSDSSMYRYDSEKAVEFFADIISEDDRTSYLNNALTSRVNCLITDYQDTGRYLFTLTDTDGTEYEMNDAMYYSLFSSMYHCELMSPNNAEYLYTIDITDKETGKSEVTFNFMDNDNVMINKSVSETFFVKIDVNKLLENLHSALNTEIKHTEDNAAYYLPFANFVKMGNAEYYVQSTGESGTLDDTQSIAAQDIFYGYDWASHDVTAEKKSNRSLDSEYRFSFFVGGIDDNNTLNIGVTDDGYIIEYFMDSKGNIVHDEDTKYYKFSNTDIYDSIKALLG